MANDNYKGVKWSDGEGLTHEDLNDGQNWLKAILFDQVIESLIGDYRASTGGSPEFMGLRGTDAPTHLAYCLNPGSAYLRLGTANNKLQIAPGVLLQKTAASDGEDATLLAYQFAGTEEVTIPDGHATQYRVDIVQMKLELEDTDPQTRDFKDATTGVITSTTTNKKRRVKCTLSVKSGSTHATSPTYPDPDPGYVCVAGVQVNPGYTVASALQFKLPDISGGAYAHVHDQRMPLGIKNYVVDPLLMKEGVAANWALSSGNIYQFTQVGGSNDLYALCPTNMGRVVGVQMSHGATGIGGSASTGSLVFTAGQWLYDGTLTYTERNVLATSVGAAGPSTSYDRINYQTFEGTPTGGIVCQPSATNKIGPPLWANGYRCFLPGGSGTQLGTVAAVNCHNWNVDKSVNHIIFYVAGGI